MFMLQGVVRIFLMKRISIEKYQFAGKEFLKPAFLPVQLSFDCLLYVLVSVELEVGWAFKAPSPWLQG